MVLSIKRIHGNDSVQLPIGHLALHHSGGVFTSFSHKLASFERHRPFREVHDKNLEWLSGFRLVNADHGSALMVFEKLVRRFHRKYTSPVLYDFNEVFRSRLNGRRLSEHYLCLDERLRRDLLLFLR